MRHDNFKPRSVKRILALVLSAGMIIGQPALALAEEAVVEDNASAVTENVLNEEENTTENLPETDDSGTVEESIQNSDMAVPQEESLPEEESSEESETAEAETREEKEEEARYVLEYQTHSQTIGWQDWKKDGEMAGTSGLKKRLEAISIRIQKETGSLENPDGVKSEVMEGAVQYQVHSQTYGNMDPVQDGVIAGTTGEEKRLEAIRINLTGEVAEKYDIYYQVHCSRFGDMGWAKNGEWAGTNGYARAMEAITIRLVEKGSADAPAQTTRSFISPTEKGVLTYKSHVQTYGWLDSVADGEVSGTQGKAKRMEAIQLYMTNPKDENGNEIEGSIQYRVQTQTYGWMDWENEGEIAGTIGEAKRMEAIQIQLTGKMAELYDVYYRAHCSRWGTLGWAKNGEIAGTVGFYRAIESIEIKVLPKGSAGVPEQTGRACLDKTNLGNVVLTGSVAGKGWQDSKGNSGIIGTIGESRTLDGIKMTVENGQTGNFSGGISYSVHMQGSGWNGEVSDGAEAGNPGSGKRMEAVKIQLTGELAKYFDVYYSAHVQAYGWLGWAKNGQMAGTVNCSYRMEALQVCIVPKTAPAPGANENYFKDVRKKVRYENAVNTILNEAGRDLYSCYRWAIDNMSYQTLPIPMAPPAGYTEEEGYAIYAVENRRGNCYCFAAAFVAAAKALGYDARLIQGNVGRIGGGRTPHGWAEIDIDGTTYVCDPDGEYELGMNFYMVHYGSAGLDYRK